jgi:hypothetical protein
VLVVLLGIMERGLKWRHGENQPAVASINAGKLEQITKKDPVGFGILGMNNDMRSIDQRELRLPSVAAFSHCAARFASREPPLKTLRC